MQPKKHYYPRKESHAQLRSYSKTFSRQSESETQDLHLDKDVANTDPSGRILTLATAVFSHWLLIMLPNKCTLSSYSVPGMAWHTCHGNEESKIPALMHLTFQ